MANFVDKAFEKIDVLSDEQIEHLLSMVREEKEEFNSILESLHTGLITVDNSWMITRMNRAAKRFIPVRKFHTDKKVCIWNVIENEEISAFLQTAALKKNTNVSEEFSIEKGSNILFITVSILPLLKKKEIAGSIILVSDITSKRHQEILSHRMENLNTLTALAASVAHEIKNPLGAISIHVQLLQKAVSKARKSDGMLPDEKFMEKYIDVVNEEIESLNRIVLDFLFAVRPVQANFVLSDPDSVVSRSVDFFMPELESCGVSIECSLSNQKERLLIDEKLFREVLANLIQNAKHALEEIDEAKIVIKSVVSTKNRMYVLTFADNGIGMDEETLGHVFEPYYTTKADGTGLGLTTVYKIIKEFQGDITVQSRKNFGTIFTISIPLPQNETMLLENR